MSTRNERIQIVLDIEAQEGVRTYQSLVDETRKVNDQMALLKRQGKENSDEFKKLSDRTAQLNSELKELGGAGANMGQLLNRSKALNAELKRLVPGTERFIQATAELKEVNTRLADIRAQVKGVSQEMEADPSPFFTRIAGGVTGVQNAFRAFLALEVLQWFVSLFRTVDETTQVFSRLRGAIGQFTQAEGAQLDEYTTRVAAISTTFGKETDEVLIAANALTQQLTGDFSTSLFLTVTTTTPSWLTLGSTV